MMAAYTAVTLSALALASLLVAVNSGTLPPPAAETVSPQNVTGIIDPYKNNKVECTQHRHCSCVWGVPVCHEYLCYCVYTNRLCSSHVDCANRCDSGIGICVESACKCYKLVEDTELSDSISPMVGHDDNK